MLMLGAALAGLALCKKRKSTASRGHSHLQPQEVESEPITMSSPLCCTACTHQLYVLSRSNILYYST